MREIRTILAATLLFFPALGLQAQEPDGSQQASIPNAAIPAEDARQSIVAWTPPALEAMAQHADVRNSFVLDRTALSAVQALMPESDDGLRPAIHKLDGIGVHLYRFHDPGQIDPMQLEEIRQAYRARGWKHLVSQGGAPDAGHKKTDLWLVLDGVTVRGGAMMLVTPKSVSLVTFAGDLNPIDVLRLRGHFGIPAAGGDSFLNTK